VLTAYLSTVRALLQNPPASTQLYSDANLTSFINTARGQLAGEAECIRAIGTIPTIANQQAYNFSTINAGVPAATGIQAPIHVRRINVGVGNGQVWVEGRPWEWFNFYVLNNPIPNPAQPSIWAQYGQGAAPSSQIGVGATGGGSFYINVPDAVYTLYCDCVCYPIALAVDGDAEAIPYQWTDAVPFLACYYALLSAQTDARRAAAEAYYNYYKVFLERARTQANPSPLRWQYEQAGDPVQAMKLGVKPPAGAAA
jgi:hypothetical protein